MRRKNKHKDPKLQEQAEEERRLKEKMDKLQAENQSLRKKGASAGDRKDNVIVMTCPDGVSPGQVLIASTSNGEEVEIEVPEDVRPGDEFEIDGGS